MNDLHIDAKKESKAKIANLLQSLYSVHFFIGLLGFAFLALLILNSIIYNEHSPSISHTYHTRLGDVFVGVLFSIGFFLFSYKVPRFKKSDHHGPWSIDRVDLCEWFFARVGGIGAICVAIIPVDPISAEKCREVITDSPIGECPYRIILDGDSYMALGNSAHFIAASAFFLSTAALCLLIFPNSRANASAIRSYEKEVAKIFPNALPSREATYYAFGTTIIISIIVLLAVALSDAYYPQISHVLNQYSIFFWSELAAAISFSLAWITRGMEYFTLMIFASANIVD